MGRDKYFRGRGSGRVVKSMSSGNKYTYAGNTIGATLLEGQIGGKLWCGGSSVFFGSQRPAIQRAFQEVGVWDLIDYAPTASLTIDTVQEDRFTDIQPTFDVNVTQKIQADLVAAETVLNEGIAEINSIVEMEPIEKRRREFDLRQQHRNAVSQIRRDETGAVLQNFHSEEKRWTENRNRHIKRVADCIRVFNRIFNSVVLSQVKTFLERDEVRHAWFEINSRVQSSGKSQGNISQIKKEINMMPFDGSVMSLDQLLAKLHNLYDALVTNGEYFPTPAARLHDLTEALERSPNQEFTMELNYIKASAMPFDQAVPYLQRKASELAYAAASSRQRPPAPKEPAVNTMQRTRMGGGDSRQVKGCANCGKPNHRTRDCRLPKRCFGCGSTDHLVSACPRSDGNSGEVNNSDSVSQKSTDRKENPVPAVANKFVHTNCAKPSVRYPDFFDGENSDVPDSDAMVVYTNSSSGVTDHHIGTKTEEFWKYV